MPIFRPRTELATHIVANQPPPFEDINLFTSDRALCEAVTREGGAIHAQRLDEFGARAGSAEIAEWATQANRNTPELRTFDRYGQRIDEVHFHPAWHRLMDWALGAGVSGIAWTAPAAGHVAHVALEFLLAQAEPGVCCPVTMTYAGIPALRHQPDVARVWEPRLTAAAYDGASLPAEKKRGCTIGMAMTEKQGGSDVRANTTKAEPDGNGAFRLTGHKWFCSAPMSDAFLTLGYAPKGLTCFLVPRWRPDGERNTIHVMRLKDKLGDRANASSEIEYHGAHALLIGEEGRGVATILEMVHHTRLDCTLAPAALMRSALANALWHCAHRVAFQRRLIDQPLMQSVLADLALESEAATVLSFRIARAFDETGKGDRTAALFSRIATPVAKYWLNKRVVNFVYEAMECLGGGGYVEESVMPRLYRQAPLNSIWEGSGNVICLDVLRALDRTPECGAALIAELDLARGNNAALDRSMDEVKAALTPDLSRNGRTPEAAARRLVEVIAVTLQAALLTRHAPPQVADAFCATRLADRPGRCFGALDVAIDADAIIRRAMPQAG